MNEEQIIEELRKLKREVETELAQGLSKVQISICKGLIEFLSIEFPEMNWRVRREVFLHSPKLQQKFCEFMQKRGVNLVYENGQLVLKL